MKFRAILPILGPYLLATQLGISSDFLGAHGEFASACGLESVHLCLPAPPHDTGHCAICRVGAVELALPPAGLVTPVSGVQPAAIPAEAGGGERLGGKEFPRGPPSL